MSNCNKEKMSCKNKCRKNKVKGLVLHCDKCQVSNYHIAKLGNKIHPFKMNGIDANGKMIEWNIMDNYEKGKWTVLFFYPADFTFVCPTEIKGFSDLNEEFKKCNAELVGVSVDSPFVHLNWVNSSLGKVNIPLLSDQTHRVSKHFNIYDSGKGISWRGTFIICPKGTLWASYSTIKEVGRDPKEVLRLLQSCQGSAEGKLMPCGWKPGEKTIELK